MTSLSWQVGAPRSFLVTSGVASQPGGGGMDRQRPVPTERERGQVPNGDSSGQLQRD